MAIENGIITGLIHNEKYIDNNPIIMEKTEGFKLKFPSVYNSIVFNTNPILYEDWSELFKETNCNLLMMYRYIPDNGLYIKIINVRNNGRIIYSMHLYSTVNLMRELLVIMILFLMNLKPRWI